MAASYSWVLGMEAPKLIAGRAEPGVMKHWVVQAVITAIDNGRDVIERTTFRTRDKILVTMVTDAVNENIKAFTKEYPNLKSLSWLTVSR